MTLDATALRPVFRGPILSPDDDGYDEARRVWNGNIDRHPALIARCTGVADIIEAVNFARANQLPVAVRAGSHNAAGHGTCDDGVLVDLSPMKGIFVDRVNRTAQVQPGVLWVELDRETQLFGLATTGGTVSNTGVAGLTLGGGIGWLGALHGLTCDNLLSADVVLADGRLVRASKDENEDLFWALRGGGGNFGIVTRFEFQLHEVGPMVLGGLVLHPLDRAKEMLQFYRDFVVTLPDKADAYAALLTTPDGAQMAAMILGYTGPIEEGERVLEPARKFGPPVADMVSVMPYTVRQTLLDEGMATHGWQRYWKSGLVPAINDQLIDSLVEGARHFSSPMSAIALFPLHGAVTRVPSDATAFSVREPVWDCNAIAQWIDPAESEQHIAWTRQVWAAIEPHTSGGAYVKHLAGDDRPEKVRASYGTNYERLLAVKRKYDPSNLFRFNPNIQP